MLKRWRCKRCDEILDKKNLKDHTRKEEFKNLLKSLNRSNEDHEFFQLFHSRFGRDNSFDRPTWFDCGPVVIEKVSDYHEQLETFLGNEI